MASSTNWFGWEVCSDKISEEGEGRRGRRREEGGGGGKGWTRRDTHLSSKVEDGTDHILGVRLDHDVIDQVFLRLQQSL